MRHRSLIHTGMEKKMHCRKAAGVEKNGSFISSNCQTMQNKHHSHSHGTESGQAIAMVHQEAQRMLHVPHPGVQSSPADKPCV